MKTQTLKLFTNALSVLAFCSTAHAVVYPNPLATTMRTVNNVPTEGFFSVLIGQNFGLGTGNAIFDTLSLNLGSVGNTYYVTQVQDPDFNALVAVLQNGTSENIAFEYNVTGVVGIAQAENAFFAPLPPGNNGIDFQGFPIDHFTLHVDSATLVGPSLYDVQVTISVNSAPVPEPSTGALALMGGTACTFFVRRRKH